MCGCELGHVLPRPGVLAARACHVCRTAAPPGCAGIMLFDYYWVRRRQLDVDALFSDDPASAYAYSGGWNPAALAALAAGAAPTLPGLLHTLCGMPVPRVFTQLYSAAWFVGFFVSGLVYAALMRRPAPQQGVAGGTAA